MAIKKLALLIPFLLSSAAWAGVIEHCPKVADIKEVGTASYTAPTVSGEGQWHGTSQGAGGPVAGFDEAIFKAHGEPVKGGRRVAALRLQPARWWQVGYAFQAGRYCCQDQV